MSVAGGMTLEDDTVVIVDPTTLGIYDDTFRFDAESVVGLQAQTVISDKLRGTVQIVAKSYNNYDAAIDWAYLSYDLKPNLTLNAGRFRLPIFYYSDFLDVGYTYYWVRPPVEVYSIHTATLEGVNLYHTNIVGDLEIATQAWYGGDRTTQESELGTTTFDSYNNQGINTQLDWKWFKLRLLYLTTDVTAESYYFDPVTVDVTFTAAAFMVDHGNFMWRSELSRTDSGVSDDVAWYASAAYNVGDFTPHFTHARVHADNDSLYPDSVSNTVGLSWNFHRSAVFKIEYTDREEESTVLPVTDGSMISTAIDILF